MDGLRAEDHDRCRDINGTVATLELDTSDEWEDKGVSNDGGVDGEVD
jgi:hypothetical protein